MKRFSNYIIIDEAFVDRIKLKKKKFAPAWSSSASEKVFFREVFLPISTPIFNRVFGGTLRTTVFHVTAPKNVNRLAGLQGKKKSISAFTVADPRVYEHGVKGGGGVVAEIEADILLSSGADALSQPDKTGRRWVEAWTMPPHIRKPVISDAENGILKLIQKYEKMVPGLAPDKWSSRAVKGSIPQQRAVEVWSEMDPSYSPGTGNMSTGDISQLQRKMIADYIDTMERVVMNNAKAISGHYRTVIDRHPSPNGWNELVVNNIKIKRLLVLPKSVDNHGTEQIIDDKTLKDFGKKFTVSIFNDKKYLHDYVLKVNSRLEALDK